MITKKKCVAMLLAGGQGSRLGVLTKLRAKPGVPYGGKYKIIDFTLSNCTHSGIDTVGILTQYQPFELNSYIGTGAPWDLDVMTGGAFVLPPYVSSENSKWYSGTANAIYQNFYFIEKYDPDYVLVLSGDHIYKMDYNKMIKFHAQKEADVTIAVIKVPLEEANRFGIMNVDENMRISEFDEKPENPKNDMASMGVYVFTWSKLKKYLIEDSKNKASSNDFGKNVIPAFLEKGEKVYAYPFEGYWKDVGTIESLWEANMELLHENPKLDLYDTSWRIFSRNPNEPPQFVGEDANIKNSMISEGCAVYGTVENSILFSGVTVGKDTVIKDSIIMQNCTIESQVVINKTIIDENVLIEKECQVGGDEKITVIGSESVIKAGNVVDTGDRINPLSVFSR